MLKFFLWLRYLRKKKIVFLSIAAVALVVETSRFRVTRYWISGPNAGKHDVFIDNLPGFPDNISYNHNGTFWLAVVSMRDKPTDDGLASVSIKKFLSKLPKSMRPKVKPYGLVVALDEQGNITKSMHDPSGQHLWGITSVVEHAGSLFIGSATTDRIGRFKLE